MPMVAVALAARNAARNSGMLVLVVAVAVCSGYRRAHLFARPNFWERPSLSQPVPPVSGRCAAAAARRGASHLSAS